MSIADLKLHPVWSHGRTITPSESPAMNRAKDAFS